VGTHSRSMPAVAPAPVVAGPPSSEPTPALAPVPDVRRRRTPPWLGVGGALLVLVGGVMVWLRASPPEAPPPVQVAAPTPSPPSPAPSSLPPASPAPSEATAAPRDSPAPAAPVEPAKGQLIVQAVPYADFYLDGKLYRRELQQPLSIPLAPGTYQLSFRHPSRTENVSVTITAASKVTKKFNVPRKK